MSESAVNRDQYRGMFERTTARLDKALLRAIKAESDLRRLRQATKALVEDWDRHPCSTCGGTGVAWDWPQAVAVRDLLR